MILVNVLILFPQLSHTPIIDSLVITKFNLCAIMSLDNEPTDRDDWCQYKGIMKNKVHGGRQGRLVFLPGPSSVH